MEVLSSCDSWLCFACLRSNIEKEIIGRLSRAWREVCRVMFLGTSGFSVTGAGVPLYVNDAHGNPRACLLWGTAGGLIADADALRACWSCKGASGNHPCLCCGHLVANWVDRVPPLVGLSCPNPAEFGLKTNEQIWHEVDELLGMQAAGRNKKAIGEGEKEVGLNLNPQGILADVALRPYVRPASVTRYDGMHIWFSNGTFEHEVWNDTPATRVVFDVMIEHHLARSAGAAGAGGGVAEGG